MPVSILRSGTSRKLLNERLVIMEMTSSSMNRAPLMKLGEPALTATLINALSENLSIRSSFYNKGFEFEKIVIAQIRFDLFL